MNIQLPIKKLILTGIFFLEFTLGNSQNISLDNLITYSRATNWEDVNRSLISKNWEYHDSEKGDLLRYHLITWVFEKNFYDDKAIGWFYLYCYDGFPNKIVFQSTKQSDYLSIKNSILSRGFKESGNSIEDGAIINSYENTEFIIRLSARNATNDVFSSSSFASYYVSVIKKTGYYDPENGKKVEYYADGKTPEMVYFLKNGRIDGPSMYYYPNGSIKIKGNFKNDSREGKFEEFDENGNKTAEYFRVGDSLDGKFIHYLEDGRIRKISNYYQGTLNGEVVEYIYPDPDGLDGSIFQNYSNGKQEGRELWVLKNEGKNDTIRDCNYHVGQLNGLSRSVIKDSLIFANYLNGELHGRYIVYYNFANLLLGKITSLDSSKSDIAIDGQYYYGKKTGFWRYFLLRTKVREGSYLNDLKSGEWRYYSGPISYLDCSNRHVEFANGKLKQVANYSNGLLNGELHEFSFIEETPLKINGDSCKNYRWVNIDEVSHYRMGKLEGSYVLKDSVGNTIRQGGYKNGKREGFWEEHYLGGDFEKIVAFYQDGIKNGAVNYYNHSGELEISGQYSNEKETGEWKMFEKGKLIRSKNYYNGKPHGLWIEYAGNGNKEWQYKYNLGKLAEAIHYDIFSSGITKYKWVLISGTGYSCAYDQYRYRGDTTELSEVSGNCDFPNEHNTNPSAGVAGKYKLSFKNLPILEGKIRNGKREGDWNIFYRDIDILVQAKYSSGVLASEFFVNISSGVPAEGKIFINDKKAGVTQEIKLKEGLRDGPTILINNTNGEKTKINYKEGVKKD